MCSYLFNKFLFVCCNRSKGFQSWLQVYSQTQVKHFVAGTMKGKQQLEHRHRQSHRSPLSRISKHNTFSRIQHSQLLLDINVHIISDINSLTLQPTSLNITAHITHLTLMSTLFLDITVYITSLTLQTTYLPLPWEPNLFSWYYLVNITARIT